MWVKLATYFFCKIDANTKLTCFFVRLNDNSFDFLCYNDNNSFEFLYICTITPLNFCD